MLIPVTTPEDFQLLKTGMPVTFTRNGITHAWVPLYNIYLGKNINGLIFDTKSGISNLYYNHHKHTWEDPTVQVWRCVHECPYA